MVPRNTEILKTAFTVSVDYIPETTTGISAADRAATVRALAHPAPAPMILRVRVISSLCAHTPKGKRCFTGMSPDKR